MKEKKLPDPDMLRKKLSEAMSALENVTYEQATKLRHNNTMHWSASMLSICGSTLRRERAMLLAAGEPVHEATLEECRLAYAFEKLRNTFEGLCDLQTTPSVDLIFLFHSIIAGTDELAELRKGSPCIRQIGHVPPHGSQLPEIMKEIGRFSSGFINEQDPVQAAAKIHDMIISAWPFEEFSAPTAYAVLSYCLLFAGYPLPAPEMTETDHLRLAVEYLHTGTSNGFTSLLLISLIKECRL